MDELHPTSFTHAKSLSYSIAYKLWMKACEWLWTVTDYFDCGRR